MSFAGKCFAQLSRFVVINRVPVILFRLNRG